MNTNSLVSSLRDLARQYRDGLYTLQEFHMHVIFEMNRNGVPNLDTEYTQLPPTYVLDWEQVADVFATYQSPEEVEAALQEMQERLEKEMKANRLVPVLHDGGM